MVAVISRRATRWTIMLAGFGVGGWFLLEPKTRRQAQISLQGLERFIRTVSIGATISMDYWVSMRKHGDNLSKCHTRCANRILSGCLQNGGVYVKLGQGLVAMNHILPEEYLDILEVLHDRALRDLSLKEVEQVFLEDFGNRPQELFDSFEPECVAAASLAQVFRAKTKQGEQVAVKIQYSDLRQRFLGDVWALGVLVALAAWMHPDYNFRWVLDYLRSTLVKELDFELEAQNMKKCSTQLANLEYVHVPQVVDSLTSKRVLTMEWIDGIKISQKAELLQMGYSLYDIDYKLITAFSQQVFWHGFLHADPHPGNVLVSPNPCDPRVPRLVLLDHGLYETLSDKDRLTLCSLWRSIVYNDGKGMQEHTTVLGISPEHYRIFCEILVQRPLLFRQRNGIPLAKGLDKEEMEYMKNMVARRHVPNL
ncbi:putative aarF domain-containing protein kinase 5-like [Tropilaelaps mercedesae]|uniref:Putative aarF domain-containing protein kinase 5-like n=1 Tax=Tropilaelaps mercedesae TaxID=418985 RepID=A0A1V9X1L9_9ACAR|nr:putative aarF domain-containing protein kinase 5-like [Tropilaelaps mercedesae]